MIKITYSDNFENDVELALEWLAEQAIKDGKNPFDSENLLREELVSKLSSIQDNPFIYASYGPQNPTRRAVLMYGNYILEYQLTPAFTKNKRTVKEIILTALVPARSERYQGAHENIQTFTFDGLFEGDE